MESDFDILDKIQRNYDIDKGIIKLLYDRPNDELSRIKKMITFISNIHTAEQKLSMNANQVGRPRKYLTDEEARIMKIKKTQEAKLRRKKLKEEDKPKL